MVTEPSTVRWLSLALLESLAKARSWYFSFGSAVSTTWCSWRIHQYDHLCDTGLARKSLLSGVGRWGWQDQVVGYSLQYSWATWENVESRRVQGASVVQRCCIGTASQAGCWLWPILAHLNVQHWERSLCETALATQSETPASIKSGEHIAFFLSGACWNTNCLFTMSGNLRCWL